MNRTAAPEHVASLERGLRVLQTFSREHAQLTLSEVAALTSLSPATARRSLHTLETLGYVGRSGRKFLLRPKVLAIGAGYLSAINAEVVLQPFLQQLVSELGGSASIALLDDQDVVYIAYASGNRAIRIIAGPGARYPAYATATGRVLLAFQPRDLTEAYLRTATFQKLTNLTVTDPEALREILLEIRESGYASIQDELDYGLASVAVPVLIQGRVIAAVACTDVIHSGSKENLVEQRLDPLRLTTRRIESALAHHPQLLMSVEAAMGDSTRRPQSAG
jgi:IclR family pca regulon transcriptional regulator